MIKQSQAMDLFDKTFMYFNKPSQSSRIIGSYCTRTGHHPVSDFCTQMAVPQMGDDQELF